MRVLLVEAPCGISGDMFVAAAAALAKCEEEVAGLPGKLGLAGVRCVFRDVVRSSLRCRKFDVEEDPRPAGDGGHGGIFRPDTHGEPWSGGDLQPAKQHTRGHAHRPLSEIRAMIEAADLDAAVRSRAVRMFDRLGAVEAAAHGIPVEQVHFHEVGAVDSIVDIVAAALCLERLGIEVTCTTPVCLGSGTVRTDHGILPVPAPATEKLLQGIPTFAGELTGEWTTPTGALILAELGAQSAQPVLVTRASALGAGNRDPKDRPNALRLRLGDTAAEAPATAAARQRWSPKKQGGHGCGGAGVADLSGVARREKLEPGEASLGETRSTCEAEDRSWEAPAAAAEASLEHDELVAICCNIDDTSGELLGADLIDALLGAGARDAIIQPVIMKKGRPGQRLEVLAEPAHAEALAQFVLVHTSTIGVRMHPVSRVLLPREAVVLETSFGAIAAKAVRLPDGRKRIAPEYESCREAAARAGVPAQEVYRAALARAQAEETAADVP